MNKTLSTVLLASIVGVASATAIACPGGHEGHGKMGDRIVEKLDLTAEQETQFKEILEAQRDEMKSYRETQREQTLEKLSSVLNADQLAEFKEMTQRWKERHDRN